MEELEQQNRSVCLGQLVCDWHSPPLPCPSAEWEPSVCCPALCHQACVLQVGEGPATAYSGARGYRDKFSCYQEHPEKDGGQACSLCRYQQPLWSEGKHCTRHFPPMVLSSLSSFLIPSLSLPLKDCPPQSFYGVFDGHVSVEAAEYASIHMLPNLVHHPDFRTNPESALRGAIDLTDKRFCQIVSDRVMLSYGPVDSSLSLSFPRIRRLAPLLWWLY